MQFVASVNTSTGSILPSRSIDFTQVQYGGFNYADQVRKGEYFPLQFTYEAADCRIFYTKATWNNFTALWQHAAAATWSNGSLCVPHSAEHRDTSKTDAIGPSAQQKAQWAATGPTLPGSHALNEADMTLNFDPLRQDWIGASTALNDVCADNGACPGRSQACISTVFCRNGEWITQPLCRTSCRTSKDCGANAKYFCNTADKACDRGRCQVNGYCELRATRTDAKCSAIANDAALIATLSPVRPVSIDDDIGAFADAGKPQADAKPEGRSKALADKSVGGAVKAGLLPWG